MNSFFEGFSEQYLRAISIAWSKTGQTAGGKNISE